MLHDMVNQHNSNKAFMNLEKAKKRIAKQVKKGFNGYPKITIAYLGDTTQFADEVIVTFCLADGADEQKQSLRSKNDVRSDQEIQSVLIRIIDRAAANTVIEHAEVVLR